MRVGADCAHYTDDPKALGTIEEVGQHLQQLEHNNLGIYKKNRVSIWVIQC